MQSHTYEFNGRDVLHVIGPAFVPILAFALLMHLGAAAKLLPKPRPTLDVDRTILVHKAEASRSKGDAQVLLIGDSSCMIDVQACELGQTTGMPALNLGTLSYLGLESHAALLREYFALNPGRVRIVVLLMHPEALRLVAPAEYHAGVLQHFLRGTDFGVGSSPRDHVLHWLGSDFFRDRWLARAVPVPLGGPYGRKYGFTSDLESYLNNHCGSLADPDARKFKGNPEYRLAARFEKDSRVFRASLPREVKLLVGITPVPSGYAQGDYARTREQMLAQWQRWLEPAAILTNLPATLPDHLFVSVTHLSGAGAHEYTSMVAEFLRKNAPE
ncbi:MAG TPA: hypothetical protein VJ063_22135 [Verrucomicrobiae bacterium]|nr:hypothetical protein [Verrucomicrobiae bacterium]